jgi:asparagine synthase (glutamine-hydrolysing)
MCGIVGVFKRQGSARVLDPAKFETLVDELAHRGPDGRGILHRHLISLGHRRLSIIDPSAAGTQPMSASGCHLTYNGEVYNYRAIRDELQDAGYRFSTQSDTEVILQAYRAWGLEALDRLYGIFAFALYDEPRQELHLVRDRLGVKPLYWSEIDGNLVFGSELKTLINFPGFVRRLDVEAVSAFLSLRHPAETRTYFAGAQCLLPGSCLSCRVDGDIQLRRWWTPTTRRSRRVRRLGDRGRVRRRVSDAVRRNMVSDVPVGAYLSGGLDSSLILNLMTQATDSPVLAFTAGFDDPDFDESNHAALVSARYGATQLTVPIAPDSYVTEMRKLIRFKDQPLGMHNEVAAYLLARHASTRVKVVLSGEGADELFCGYGRIFRTPLDWRRLQIVRRLPPLMRRAATSRLGLEAESEASSAFDLFCGRYTYFPATEKLALFRPEVRWRLKGDARVRRVLREAFDAPARGSLHDRISRVFLAVHLPGLLTMMDATGMAAGLEVRVPFVEHDVVATALDLPRSSKLRWRSPVSALRAMTRPVAEFSEVDDETKSELRRAFAAQLPDEVNRRKKVVFAVPLNDWFAGSLGQEFERYVLADDARSRCLFDPDLLREWMRKQGDGSDPQFGRKAWLLLNLELFLREYFDDDVVLAWQSPWRAPAF